MTPTTHTIDPSGDTLLILQNANAPFAVLSSDAAQKTQQNKRGFASADKSQKTDIRPEVRMRLSSKHLSLASAYFQKLTAGNWKETIPEDGYSYTIHAQEWDEEAMLTLMNIIHGQTAKVPRSVSLEKLAKVSVLVDYYQCHETVDFFVHTWINNLVAPTISSYGRNLILRLSVSWVFSESDLFRSLTKTIIYESRGPVDSAELPIPQRILDALNEKRENLISGILAGLHNLKTQLYGDGGHCTFECSSVNLGVLIKGMNKIHVLEPRPVRPFMGYSLLTLEKSIREFMEPSWSSHCPSRFLSQVLHGASSTERIPSPSDDLFKLPSRERATKPPLFVFGASEIPVQGPSGIPSKNKNISKPSGGVFAGSVTRPHICSLYSKTGPIIVEQLDKLKGLDLASFRIADGISVK